MLSMLSRNPINLTIKDHVIRYVELKQVNPPTILNCGEKYLPPNIIKDGKIVDMESFNTIIEQCIDEWKIKKRPVRFIVPDNVVIIRKISIPRDVKVDEIKGYLYLEIGSSIHLPFEDPVFDAVVLNETKDKKELLLFAAPEAIVTEYTEVLEDLKLKPVAADISPLSLYRLYFRLDQARQKDHLLMFQMDLQMLNISIFEEHKPIFMRHIPFDFNNDEWEQQVSRSSEDTLVYKGDVQQLLKSYEDFISEIEKIMNFYRYSMHQGKESITKIVVSGDNPFIEEIYQEVKNRVEIPVELIDISQIQQREGLPSHRYNLALGLALKEV